MAVLDWERLSCSICLDLLEAPLTLACGHSYCQACIQRLWDREDREDRTGTYSCPQCRRTFPSRPVLQKSFMLAELVEELKKAEPSADPGPGRKPNAVASCLSSACDIELQPLRKQQVGVASEGGRGFPDVPRETAGGAEAEPQTRDQFLRYARDLTLDPNTAHGLLLLSRGNRRAEFTASAQPRPQHPDRFAGWCQALSREVLMGRCYWEVEWAGRAVHVAVAYGSMGRTGGWEACVFGYSRHSWALHWNADSFAFRHAGACTPLAGPRPRRVGVYLDQPAGVLSFYAVSGAMTTLLHTVRTAFVRPLHAGLRVCCERGGAAEFVEPAQSRSDTSRLCFLF